MKPQPNCKNKNGFPAKSTPIRCEHPGLDFPNTAYKIRTNDDRRQEGTTRKQGASGEFSQKRTSVPRASSQNPKF
jgi:hypothetical protein